MVPDLDHNKPVTICRREPRYGFKINYFEITKLENVIRMSDKYCATINLVSRKIVNPDYAIPVVM